MSRNGSGTYSLPAGNPVVTGTTISSTVHNNTMSDIASALTQSVSADGQTPITANLPMNSKKITGLAAATTAGDALAYGQSSMGPIDAGAISGTTGTFSGPVATGALTTTGNASISGNTTAKGVGLVATKTATTSRASTTTVADDPHLSVALSAGTWSIDGWLPIWGTATGAMGFKFALTFGGTKTSGSFGAFGYMNANYPPTFSSDFGSSNGFASGFVDAGTSGVQSSWLRFTGNIVVTVAGSLTLQWAQNSSNVNNLNLGVGAWINCVKVA